MGRTENGGGDQLARGMAKATFRQPNVTAKKYKEATGGFNLKRFLAGDTVIIEQAEPAKKERKRA